MDEHDHDHDHEHAHGHEHADEHAEPAVDEQREREVRKRIALAQVRQYGDPALRMRAGEVDVFDEELARLAHRMTELMHDADGIGLAATQVGIVRRLFVFSADGVDHALVNPVLAKLSEETETDEEGCLSLGSVRVPVERAVAVTIEGRDLSGAEVSYELEGLPARVVQHELDHLDGTLILDRTDAEHRREALAKLRPRLLLTR